MGFEFTVCLDFKLRGFACVDSGLELNRATAYMVCHAGLSGYRSSGVECCGNFKIEGSGIEDM